MFDEITQTQDEVKEFEQQISTIHVEGREKAVEKQREEIEAEKRNRVLVEPDYLKQSRKHLAQERKLLAQFRNRYQKAMNKRRKKALARAEQQQQEARQRYHAKMNANYAMDDGDNGEYAGISAMGYGAGGNTSNMSRKYIVAPIIYLFFVQVKKVIVGRNFVLFYSRLFSILHPQHIAQNEFQIVRQFMELRSWLFSTKKATRWEYFN